jgi:hypothetical protein
VLHVVASEIKAWNQRQIQIHALVTTIVLYGNGGQIMRYFSCPAMNGQRVADEI